MAHSCNECIHCDLLHMHCRNQESPHYSMWGVPTPCLQFTPPDNYVENKVFREETFFEDTGCPMTFRWESKLELDIDKDISYGVLIRDSEAKLLAAMSVCEGSSWREHFYNKLIIDDFDNEHIFPFEEPIIFTWATVKLNFSENFTHLLVTIEVCELC